MSSRMVRQDRDRKMRSFLKYSVLILITFLTIGLIYRVGQNISTLYNRNNLQTSVTRYGCLQQKLKGEGILLLSETIVAAPANGYFENIVAEKEKVARNTQVGYFISMGRRSPMYAPAAGIFTRQVDGLESALKDIKLSSVGPEVFKYKAVLANPAQEMKSGQNVYKIVNNLMPSRLLLRFPLQGKNLSISVHNSADLIIDGKSLGSFKIEDLKQDSQQIFMIAEDDQFVEGLLEHRHVKAEIRINSSYGYLIPEKSLAKKGKERGIYCTKGENIVFKPVKVLDQNDDTAVVEGLEATDLIIINPGVLAHNL